MVAEHADSGVFGIVACDEINAQNPDVVCIAGDFFDTNYDAIENPERRVLWKKITATMVQPLSKP